MAVYQLSHLRALEHEAIHILREMAAERERPVLLFSGGKDSIVLLKLAEKAFRPARFPFPIMHVDTGHNFPEVIEYRDRVVAALGERLIVASVEESIAKGRATEDKGARASRNRLQDPRRDRLRATSGWRSRGLTRTRCLPGMRAAGDSIETILAGCAWLPAR
jgi:sulfate adenylyltransferase subunit 2